MTDGQTGLGVLNRGTMGSVRERDGSFSVPLAFAVYYIWGTRMLNGDFTYEFAWYPFTGDLLFYPVESHLFGGLNLER